MRYWRGRKSKNCFTPEKTPAPAIAEVSHGASPDGQATSEAARPAAPPAGTEVAPLMLDEICKRDEERLERLRSNPSSEEAARFADELSCEKLRPQLLALIEDLGRSAPSAAAIGVAKSEASDIRATNDGPTLRPPLLPNTQVAAATPDDVCKRDEERLERLRSNPSSEEAARFANELSCEKLRPQLLALIEDLGRSAPAAAAIGVANERGLGHQGYERGRRLQPRLLPTRRSQPPLPMTSANVTRNVLSGYAATPQARRLRASPTSWVARNCGHRFRVWPKAWATWLRRQSQQLRGRWLKEV